MILWLLLVLSALVHSAFAQGSAGELALYESQRIVDMPTAGVLPPGGFLLRLLMFEQGGMLGETLWSPLSRVQVGIGYSGSRVIGSLPVEWQGVPAVQVRWRVVDETLTFPAVAIGLETLGRGNIIAHAFATPAPGAFLALSKQFRWALGGCAVHLGAGYSFDLRFNGRDMNAWVGLEQSLGRSAALSVELNPQSVERDLPLLLNAVVRWSVLRGATLELYARDMLVRTAPQPIRSIGVEFIALISQLVW
ncbi:MAG: hypothetical protein RML15_07775 [Bacteroidota bacterium]|nr:YjbH domain-containing protein [Candidatus Kapabacteria bacterium]MCS7303399.1 YjbH domain-containing protein [Candidatus Kapabacteria bacterium]MCX7937415.1 YjbH domain-containing protein [Chlorobiota bacterium]MDW8075657.1 hypothetical protein [Bacteroidota bacterium]MDW8272286.1 hypothetical protein [Bacteroidota bacterium]